MPVSRMWALKVTRSTTAATRRGPGKMVPIHPGLNGRLVPMAMEARSWIAARIPVMIAVSWPEQRCRWPAGFRADHAAQAGASSRKVIFQFGDAPAELLVAGGDLVVLVCETLVLGVQHLRGDIFVGAGQCAGHETGGVHCLSGFPGGPPGGGPLVGPP